jgi:hypothetical protein
MAEIYSNDRRTRVRMDTWYWRFAWSTAGANIIVEGWHSTWFWGAWDKILVPELGLVVNAWGKKDPSNPNESESPARDSWRMVAGGGFRQVNVGYSVPGGAVDVFAAAGFPSRPDGTITLTRVVASGWARLQNGEYISAGPQTARY